MRVRLALTLLLVGLCVAAPLAGAARSDPAPLAVESGSLTQDGQQLVWTVNLTTPFSPAGLKGAGRSLCLLLKPSRRGAVAARLCVIGPRAGASSARIVYQPVTRAGPGRARIIEATVTRVGSHGLTASFDPATFGLRYAPLRWQVLSSLRSPACPSAEPGADQPGCVNRYPVHPASAPVHQPELTGCVDSGSPFVNQGPITGHMIALTFDDGPWSDTPRFLEILEHYHVPATFFEIGDQVATYGQGGAIERRMLADGDMIGDHTWNHANVSAGGPFAASEISRAAAAIKAATHGFTPCLFRAPYGAVGPGLLTTTTALGFKTIQWDIDPRDWARPGVAAIYGNVIANAHPGAIIIQHDGGGDRSQTLDALPREISTLEARGYQFVTITQLFGMKLLYR